MALIAGTRLGPYEISDQIGAGGMGEVYRATDTRLDRAVAIKVLPEHLATDPQRRERFEREAKVVSSLNHPHICTLYDVGEQDGTHFLVMELVDGQTLERRLQKGRLPLDQALEYAIQVADALDKAHRQGVVHRDLKPGNIMLTKSGVKLLDFGLAKLKGDPVTASPMSQIPTQGSAPLTAEGTILGTLQYMAPEQLEGKDADARTDIFAFGAVVYEMVTGKKAFEGDSQANLIGAILKDHPQPMASLQEMTPPTLDRVVTTCLAKDPDDRWQTASDLGREVLWIAEAGSELQVAAAGSAGPAERSRAWTLWITSIVAAVAGALAVSLTFWSRSADVPASDQTPIYIPFALPEGVNIGTAFSPRFDMSPDGRQLVYVGNTFDGRSQLFLLDLESSAEPRPLEGTAGITPPVFFSADGDSVAFVDSNQILRKLSLSGGIATPIVRLPRLLSGGSWGSDGTIVINLAGRGLSRVSAEGGELEELIPQNTSWPQFTPDGQFIIFSVRFDDYHRPGWLSLQDGDYRLIDGIERSSTARYLASGHLVWADGDDLYAAAFDLAAGELVGPAMRVVEGVQSWPISGITYFDVSDSGDLVYAPGGVIEERQRLVRVDERGERSPISTREAAYRSPQFSPDGNSVAVNLGTVVIDVFDVATGRGRPVTSTAAIWPRWTSDGTRITYTEGYRRVVSASLREDSSVQVLFDYPEGEYYPGAWHPHEDVLLVEKLGGETGGDIMEWAASESTLAPVVATQAQEGFVDLSPDGQWLAYESDASGSPQIWVKRYRSPEPAQPVTNDGGREPRWSHDGTRLYFWGDNDNSTSEGDGQSRLMFVDVEFESEFRPSLPDELFRGPFLSSTESFSTTYDASPKEDSFVMLETGAPGGVARLTIVLNWLEELKERVPVP